MSAMDSAQPDSVCASSTNGQTRGSGDIVIDESRPVLLGWPAHRYGTQLFHKAYALGYCGEHFLTGRRRDRSEGGHLHRTDASYPQNLMGKFRATGNHVF